MNFEKSRILMWIGCITGIFIMIIGFGLDNEKVTGIFMIAGMLVFFASLVQAFIFYVCPYCGYSLMNVRGEVPEYCPKCGKKL